jgi:CO/xanthine dehydrogenase Mo-binding subunit
LQTRVVGVSVPRKEGVAKLTGQARYIDDLSLPGMIFGATVRSSIARGAIEDIQFGEGIPWHEFTIVTAKDIPGRNVVLLIVDDQPCLADGMVNPAAGASRSPRVTSRGGSGQDLLQARALDP